MLFVHEMVRGLLQVENIEEVCLDYFSKLEENVGASLKRLKLKKNMFDKILLQLLGGDEQIKDSKIARSKTE